MSASSSRLLGTTKEKKLKRRLKDKTSQFSTTSNFTTLRDSRLEPIKASEFKTQLTFKHSKNHLCQSKTSLDLSTRSVACTKKEALFTTNNEYPMDLSWDLIARSLSTISSKQDQLFQKYHSLQKRETGLKKTMGALTSQTDMDSL
jgi:hypothetical protein